MDEACAAGLLQGQQAMQVKPLSDVYQTQRVKSLGHLLRRPYEHIEKACTFLSGTPKPLLNHVRRVGHPRQNWAQSSMGIVWPRVVRELGGGEDFDQPFDMENADHVNAIHLAAHADVF